MDTKKYELEVGGKKLVAEFSDLADQANGSVLVKYGDTAVFAAATMGAKRDGLDYFPLTVDYEERHYAAGMILGSRFMKREGKPSEEAILTSRVVDRTIRPLFNHKIRNEVQVAILTLAVDGVNDTDIPAIIAGSLALGTSNIPWGGPVGGVRIGYIDEKFVINPTYEERDKSLLDVVVCGRGGTINMIEAGAKELPEEKAVEALELALKEITKIEEFQKKIIAEIGKEKAKMEFDEEPAEAQKLFDAEIAAEMEKELYASAGAEVKCKPDLSELNEKWKALMAEKLSEEAAAKFADEIFERNVNDIVHARILDAKDGEEKRPDGRKVDELRPLYAQAGFLPTLHGSGVFYRGGTHVLSVVTLGGPKDGQIIEGMEVQTTKHFMHHYNFPPFSTGETGRMGNPGRREIGHGALAERALSAVVPSRDVFPYTIRIVSESMASNGSTSQGSICASCLALMDAGVPIKSPVAGIAMGLMMKDAKHYKVLTDIQGPEDHHGDMDFKCAGTKDGLTAIQMDVKVDGVTVEILAKTLTQARKARMEIMDVILKAIPESRKETRPSAPCILKIQINPESIGLVIGPGGKMINRIIELTGAEVDIEQDGSVFITGKNKKDAEAAKSFIEKLTHEWKIGDVTTGPVTRLFDFGAMVEIGPEQEGLVHISELADQRVNRVSDVVKPGDVVKVVVVGVDEKGRVNLSIKKAKK